MKIILIRHGQTQWNLQQRMQGSKNSDLTPKGILQAKNNGTYLLNNAKEFSDFKIFVSPLGRAQQTAKLICEQAKIQFDQIETEKELREKDFGDFEGKTEQELIEEFPFEYPQFLNNLSKKKPPNGESEECLLRRVKKFQESLNNNTNYIFITHYFFSRTFQWVYLNDQNKSIDQFSHSQNSIIILENNSIAIQRTTE